MPAIGYGTNNVEISYEKPDNLVDFLENTVRKFPNRPYIGEKDLTVPITVVITILATGGDKQVTGYIAINGSVIAGSAIQTTASGTKAGNVTCIWQQTLQPNDYI